MGGAVVVGCFELMKVIFTYLDEPYEAISLDRELNVSGLSIINPNVFSTANPKTKNWMDYMSNREAGLIEDRLTEPMRYFQYDKYSEGSI